MIDRINNKNSKGSIVDIKQRSCVESKRGCFFKYITVVFTSKSGLVNTLPAKAIDAKRGQHTEQFSIVVLCH